MKIYFLIVIVMSATWVIVFT